MDFLRGRCRELLEYHKVPFQNPAPCPASVLEGLIHSKAVLRHKHGSTLAEVMASWLKTQFKHISGGHNSLPIYLPREEGGGGMGVGVVWGWGVAYILHRYIRYRKPMRKKCILVCRCYKLQENYTGTESLIVVEAYNISYPDIPDIMFFSPILTWAPPICNVAFNHSKNLVSPVFEFTLLLYAGRNYNIPQWRFGMSVKLKITLQGTFSLTCRSPGGMDSIFKNAILNLGLPDCVFRSSDTGPIW